MKGGYGAASRRGSRLALQSRPAEGLNRCLVQSYTSLVAYPTLRANPFPEVTDLFCRLPLPTLFFRPEAANLGDLMRLWVRPGEKSAQRCGQRRVPRAARARRAARRFASSQSIVYNVIQSNILLYNTT